MNSSVILSYKVIRLKEINVTLHVFLLDDCDAEMIRMFYDQWKSKMKMDVKK